MKQSIRLAHANVARAIQAIYAPVVSHTPISLETTPPSIEEMSQRIAIALADLPRTLLHEPSI